VDDALPAGAVVDSYGGDNWTWVAGPEPAPYSGTVSHQSAVAAGIHQHFFIGATQTLQVGVGDRLYAYVYLDPANMPSEVMLQWYSSEGGWEHRAYWGADNIIDWGTNGTASRRFMGPLPPAGQWVRLEVDASAVGLEGKTLNGMAFTLFGGRANWDRAGKVGPLYGVTPLNTKVYTVDPATNRLATLNGFTVLYDAAGNQTNDGSGQRTYDAENRMVEAKNGADLVVGKYVYDADGRRVKRISNGSETRYIYGFGGELLAEYAPVAAVTAPQKEYGYRGGQLLVVWDGSEIGDRQLQWLVQDHLGSTRMVVDRSGSLAGITRRDYAPFGEELYAGFRLNGSGQGQYGYEPPQSNVRQKFVGYERDSETWLDFAGARYFASVQGRFTSPDPLLSSGNTESPGTWNRYSYCLNNPLRFIDPTGLYVFDSSVSEDQRRRFDDMFAEAKQSLAKIGEVYGTNSNTYKMAERALNVYGNPGIDNGVTIFNEQLGDKKAGELDPVVGVRSDGNAVINIKIDTEQFSQTKGLINTIAHEGSHAADAADFALGRATNPSSYQTEFKAYTVSSLFLEALGNRYLPPLALPAYTTRDKNSRIVHPPTLVHLYQASWAEADKTALRESNINTFLAHPQRAGGLYGVTPNRPGLPVFRRRR
jgi:RHS repeat-associated protein